MPTANSASVEPGVVESLGSLLPRSPGRAWLLAGLYCGSLYSLVTLWMVTLWKLSG